MERSKWLARSRGSWRNGADPVWLILMGLTMPEGSLRRTLSPTRMLAREGGVEEEGEGTGAGGGAGAVWVGAEGAADAVCGCSDMARKRRRPESDQEQRRSLSLVPSTLDTRRWQSEGTQPPPSHSSHHRQPPQQHQTLLPFPLARNPPRCGPSSSAPVSPSASSPCVSYGSRSTKNPHRPSLTWKKRWMRSGTSPSRSTSTGGLLCTTPLRSVRLSLISPHSANFSDPAALLPRLRTRCLRLRRVRFPLSFPLPRPVELTLSPSSSATTPSATPGAT